MVFLGVGEKMGFLVMHLGHYLVQCLAHSRYVINK